MGTAHVDDVENGNVELVAPVARPLVHHRGEKKWEFMLCVVDENGREYRGWDGRSLRRR
jgi:hypothetical protein